MKLPSKLLRAWWSALMLSNWRAAMPLRKWTPPTTSARLRTWQWSTLCQVSLTPSTFPQSSATILFKSRTFTMTPVVSKWSSHKANCSKPTSFFKTTNSSTIVLLEKHTTRTFYLKSTWRNKKVRNLSSTLTWLMDFPRRRNIPPNSI